MSLAEPITVVDRDVSTPATLPHHEWELTGGIPAKPAGLEYGYVIKGQTIGSTREQLIETLVQRQSEISFVWTPATPEPVPPQQVQFLVEAYRRIQARDARKAIWWGVGLVAFGVVMALGFQDWKMLYRNVFSIFGAVLLAEGIWGYRRSHFYTQEDAVCDASAVRFTTWVTDRSLSGYSITLMACIIVVSVVQPFADNSIALTGLVKPAVWRGEVWRLLTATLMHVSVSHFWMNMVSLIYLAKIIEHTIHRAYVPLIFLVTGALGSAFSVVLYPHTTSVGASGGIMGLLGFITIAAYFDRTKYPPKYFRRMLQAIVITGLLGLFGFAFIDNAAHLGGLVGGLMMGGWRLSRKKKAKAPARLSWLGGVAAVLALVFISMFAVYRMIG